MRTALSLIFCLGLISPMVAQSNKARAYIKVFQGESRKVERKNFLYLESKLKGEDPRRIQRYREMVAEQITDSKKVVDRTRDYDGDDVLKRSFASGLDLMLEAFQGGFAEADTLAAKRYDSYANLLHYMEVIEKAELKMLDGLNKMAEAEEYFAKKYDVNLREDPEAEENFQNLDQLNVFTREMTLRFYQVYAKAEEYVAIANRGNYDSLNLAMTELRTALKESYRAFQEREVSMEDEKLSRDVEYFFEDMQEELDLVIVPATETLSNAYALEDDFEDAKDEIERFGSRLEDYKEDYFYSLNYLIEDYFPE